MEVDTNVMSSETYSAVNVSNKINLENMFFDRVLVGMCILFRC